MCINMKIGNRWYGDGKKNTDTFPVAANKKLPARGTHFLELVGAAPVKSISQ